MTTTVANIRSFSRHHTQEVKAGLSTNYVYIGRPSKWGNPFKVGFTSEPGIKRSRYAAAEAYRAWRVDNGPSLEAIQTELKDKILVCFCKPLACHGDVLAELADS